MISQWIVNASPIICLVRAGHADLLCKCADAILVPKHVVEEVNDGPIGDPGREFLALGNILVVDDHDCPEVLAWDLGKGETSVLSFAYQHPGWTAIIDDRAARNCAKSLAIPHKGTLGIIMLAKKMNIIPSASDLIRSLQAAGLRIDEQVIRKALKQILNEEWELRKRF